MSSWFFFRFPPLGYVSAIAGPEEAKNLAGQSKPPPDSDPFSHAESGKNLAFVSRTIDPAVPQDGGHLLTVLGQL
jgi:hypothetical protein